MHAIQRSAILLEAERILTSILSAYFHTKPLTELVDTKDRSGRPLQLVHIALAGAECSSCASTYEEVKWRPLRMSSLEVREEAIHQISANIASIVFHGRANSSITTNENFLLYALREHLSHVICKHDTEMLGIAIAALRRAGHKPRAWLE